MRDNRSIKEIPLVHQELTIKHVFPDSTIKRCANKSLIWVGQLRPTPLSKSYSIKIILEKGKVEVLIIDPVKLERYPGKIFLPHVYSTPKQKLCLFFPDGKEWNNGKLIVDTIIPWASEWLYFYEIWLITGNWFGGGTEHGFEKKVA
jgi:hypothetical protein